MSEWKEVHTRVLDAYPRAIVHMRAQYSKRKLGLILGAGVSKSAKIPNWKQLVERIAEHPKVRGKTILNRNPGRSSKTSQVQMLFEHFRKKEQNLIEKEFNQEWCSGLLVVNKIKERWHDIVRHKLYEKAKFPNNIREKHPYLGAFFDIIKGQPMTINYNFDDLVENMLLQENNRNDKKPKEGYQTVWDISQPIRTDSPDDAVIYHPNGFLPQAELEHKSEWLVFSEDEYADQLIYTSTGYFSSLSHHLSKNTCILLGLSLEDSTLRHLLRQQAKTNPGHYHYYITYKAGSKQSKNSDYEAIRMANFKVYNLITLFLDRDEIQALGNLITHDRNDFIRKSEENSIQVKYCFYITGAIAAGKSSLVLNFRSLDTQEEWPEIRRSVLGKSWKSLTDPEKDEVDKWIADQFRVKNWDLTESTENKEGIFVIDRCPLDPLAFTDKKEWKEKAQFILEEVCTGSGARHLHDGHVILLISDPNVMASRVKAGQEEYSAKDLSEMQEALKCIYSLNSGFTMLDTRAVSTWEYVKHASQVIHMQDYDPANLHDHLMTFIN